MPIEYPENLLTYGEVALPEGGAARQIEGIEQKLNATTSPEETANLRSRRTALRLLSQIERANTDFQNRRFQSALQGYEAASMEILTLLDGDAANHETPEIWPSGSDVVQGTAQLSADLVSQLAPDLQTVPPALPKEDLQLKPLEDVPVKSRVTVAEGTETEVENAIERANAAAAQGNWEEAADRYDLTVQTVSDRETRADLLLNLGAVEVQLGDIETARNRFTEAKEIYEDTGDDVGAAQATHNEGLAQAKAGKNQAAISTLKQAKSLAGQTGLVDLHGTTPGPDGSEIDTDGESDPSPEGDPSGGTAPTSGSDTQPSPSELDPRTNLSGTLRRPTLSSPRLPPESTGTVQPTDSNVGTFGSTPPSTLTPQSSPVGDSPLQSGAATIETLGSPDGTLRLRSVQENAVVPDVPLETERSNGEKATERVLQLQYGDRTETLNWSKHQKLSAEELGSTWRKRREVETISRLNMDLETAADVLANLGTLYHLVLPARMGDCHHELGNHREAEDEYRRAAEYEHTNAMFEGADLWRRLAENALAWGDSLYRDGDPEDAAAIYERLTSADGTAAESFLYEVESLQLTGNKVTNWLQAVEAGEDTPALNPAIAQTLHTVRRRWANLNANLGFFGDEAATVPPFTFSRLQEVARYFANQAIRAEKRYIDFYNRFEQGELKRKQLDQAVQEASKNVEAAKEKKKAAKQSRDAARASVAQAQVRHQNARDQLNEFNDVAWERKYLSGLVARGNAWTGNEQPNLDYGDYSGKRHEVLQELTRRKAEISNDLQRKRMNDAIAQANAAKAVANEQSDAAQQRYEAAKTEHAAAKQRASHAKEMHDAYDDQRFTPQVWERLARTMQWLADEALDRAIEVARLMQRAYNFEHLDDVDRIDDSYDSGYTNEMLGGDMLLSDIDSFTAREVTGVTEKPKRVKWPISLSEQYPGQFLSFTRTGHMEFELDLDRLRLAHPGTYGHKLQSVEIEVDGFLPPDGLHGRLTNAGMGKMRDASGDTEWRVQPSETMILSRYDPRRDAVVLRPEQDMRGLFEDNAVVSGWSLDVPPSANDVDLREVFDVRLVLYFECRYDEDLYERDATFRGNRSGVDFERTRAFYLRQHFPDAYYQLRETGEATIDLAAEDFPKNHTQPTLQSLSLAAVPDDDASLDGTALNVTYPGRSEPAEVTVDAEGVITSGDLPIDGEPSALDDYTISIADDQTDRADRIEDLVVITDYRFAPAGSP